MAGYKDNLKSVLSDIEGSGFSTSTDSLKILSDVLSDILTDTGTTLEAKLDTIDSIVDAILIDTNTTLEDKLDAITGTGFSTTTDSLKVISDVLDLIRTELTFQHQPDAAISQTNPVSAQYYTVLDTTPNARIISMIAKITWATTQPTSLEVRITIDGNLITHAIPNPVSATTYRAMVEEGTSETLQTLTVTAYTPNRAFLYEGRSVKVEARITWDTTQPTPLVCRVKYAKR